MSNCGIVSTQTIYSLFNLNVMNTKVIVLADEATKTVINVSENPEWGYVRLQQVRFLVDEKSGFLNAKTITALLPSQITSLQQANFYEGQEITGKIVVEESLTPWNKNNPDRDLKVAGKTGIVCRLDGAPIYRRTRFSFNEDAKDTFIQHTNVDELRSAFDNGTASAIKPNEEFQIQD